MKISNYVYLEIISLSCYLDRIKIKVYTKYIDSKERDIEYIDLNVDYDVKGYYFKYKNKKYYINEVDNRYKNL